MSSDRSSGSSPYLRATALGLAVLPAVLLVRLAIGFGLRALGGDLDTVHLLLAPERGLGGYLMGVLAFRLLTFAAVAVAAVAWSWRRWTARPALVTGAVAVVAGLVLAGVGFWSATEAAERARRAGDDVRSRIEASLTVHDLEAVAVDTGALELVLPATVRRAGAYRLRLRLEPAPSDDPDVADRAFVLDTVLTLEPGEARLPLRIGVDDLTERWGLLWRWSTAGASEAEVSVGLLLDRAELDELGGAELAALVEWVRRAGARPEDMEALRPPGGGPVHKFVSRDTFRVAAVPVLRRVAR